jgi:hypothetical protein
MSTPLPPKLVFVQNRHHIAATPQRTSVLWQIFRSDDGNHGTRVIGSQVLDSFDPFLLLDELRSDDPNQAGRL